MNYLMLTTLVHLFAVYPLREDSQADVYKQCIVLSTGLSFLWHLQGEPRDSLIYILDYTFALIWGLMDYLYALAIYSHGNDDSLYYESICIVLWNLWVLSLNLLIEARYPNRGKQYEFYHSVWHILSGVKAYIVAISIHRYIQRVSIEAQYGLCLKNPLEWENLH
jgi:hypothetical protein